MLRRYATKALISCLALSLLGSTYAVDFELSDGTNERPIPTRTPAPSQNESVTDSILDAIDHVPLPPTAEGYAPPAVPSANGAMPDSALQQDLPFDAGGYAGDEIEDWADIIGDSASDGYASDGYASDGYASDGYVSDGYASDGCAVCNGGACGCDACFESATKGHPGWYMDFWLDQGFTWNPDDPRNNFNLPVTFNDRANDYQLNQLYLVLGRRVEESGSWDVGGRVDLLYGTDYFFTQAAGLETRTDGSPRWNSADGPRGAGAALYGLAMPQLYMEVFAPVLGGINFKVGHFYTTIGYESVMAPENFFYSHAYTMQYGEPFTHTGVLSSFGITSKLRGHFAVTRGWDNWEDLNSKPGYLFGFSYSPSDDASLSATVFVGREDATGQQQRNMYSIVYTRQLGCNLRYVFQHDFGGETNAELDRQFNPDSAKWYGVNQYLFWDINSRLTAGMRLEWFRDQDNARVLGIPFESVVDGGNYTEVTFGLNWKAADHMLFRPELRWDWSDVHQVGIPGNGMFDDFTDRNQFTAALDLIIQF